MNSRHHCSEVELLSLIRDDDTSLGDPDTLNHLEHCPACQEKLASLSGQGAWLAEWVEVARHETRSLNRSARFATSSQIVVVGDALADEADLIRCDAVRLDFLQPPRHPELLGRLGRYDIERLIGKGGFGVVFKAYDSDLNRVVAIKALAPHLMGSGAARQRFAREAQASAAIVHDHVVPIYDVVSQDDACYFVMQYIPGPSLQERVDRRGPLPVEDILRIASQMASGLQAAHDQGLVHRDVKPGNVLLEESVDRVLISDFGLARTADDASLTHSGAITGTPHYMSPEQAKGDTIDGRSDLFSLGSVIYFMATGHPPFRAPQIMAVLHRICQQPHRPLSSSQPQLPRRLTQIVDRLLAKDPAGRYRSASEVAEALRELLSDVQAGRVRVSSPRLGTRLWRELGSRSRLLGMAVAVILTFLVVVSLIWRSAYQPLDGTPSAAPDAITAVSPAGSAAAPFMPPVSADLATADSLVIRRDEWTALGRSLGELERTPLLPPLPLWTDWSVQIDEIKVQLDRLEQALAASGEPPAGQDTSKGPMPADQSASPSPVPPTSVNPRDFQLKGTP